MAAKKAKAHKTSPASTTGRDLSGLWAGSTITMGALGLVAFFTFSSGDPSSNWLGTIGYFIALVSRFLFGACSLPLFAWMIWHGKTFLYPSALPLPYSVVTAIAVSMGLLANLLAENYPLWAQHMTRWAHVQYLATPHARYPQMRVNLGGVPLYFLYKDLPHLNLRHLLSDRGLSLLTSSFLATVILVQWRRRRALRRSANLNNGCEAPRTSSLLPSVQLLPSRPSLKERSTRQIAEKAVTQQLLPKERFEETFPTREAGLELLQEVRTPKAAKAPTPLEATNDKQSKKSLEPSPAPSAVALLKKAKAKGQEGYLLPSLELLTPAKSFDSSRVKGEITQQSRLLEETLLSFGIEGKVGQVHMGPRLLSFEVHPAIGVKVQRIKALENDIALNLQAKSLRIIAPIPGKAAVGIEVPTQYPQEVNFKSMVESYQAGKERFAIPVILGKTVSGEDVCFDLAKMPHMIIAGATGSGKSVCVNTIIMSILLHASAEEIRLLMVDPKKVELTPYSRLPHMIAPVITEPPQAAEALRWLVVEMERRYEILKRMGLRHVEAFNQRQREEAFENTLGIEIPPKLPYIVGIIDELADLMMTSPADIETPIARIAQMARAVGIHLILATQRPSREVITGLIKANFPARIAFKVSSRINSQIILDEIGAECLLGNGDMLFLHPSKGSLLRAQGAFIRDEDINRVVETIQMQAPPNYLLKPDLLGAGALASGSSNTSEDELFETARQLVLETGTASTTFLQRKLRIGYARAASLMDELEQHGVVGPSEGGKPRRILAASPDEQELE